VGPRFGVGVLEMTKVSFLLLAGIGLRFLGTTDDAPHCSFGRWPAQIPAGTPTIRNEVFRDFHQFVHANASV
jgi:hypothetical protein